jgi:AraC-like DNA-binding protein
MKIIRADGRELIINTPSIVFFPRPRRHRLYAPEKGGAELVCATIEFGAGMLNPLIASFPDPLVLPIDSLPEFAPALELLFSEAFSVSPARQAAIDRLFEYVLVLLMRSAMNARLIDSGALIGLGDARLARAMDAMHKHPETSWSLEELAQTAGMSRARFAAHFRQVVGTTPFDYLTDWRIGVAQTMLLAGKSLKRVAPAVGYANSTALTRVFTARLGVPPSNWLARVQKRDDRSESAQGATPSVDSKGGEMVHSLLSKKAPMIRPMPERLSKFASRSGIGSCQLRREQLL